MPEPSLSDYFKLPLTDPVLVFSLVLAIIILSQVIFHKIRLPGIVGYILAGVLVGPYGLGVLQNDSSISLLGTVGLLYIMFMAGLDLDMNQFASKKYRSIGFGLLTFAMPMILGYFCCRYLLQLNPLASILVSSMFSTHTLVAFPIVNRLGISRNEAVAIAIGGTIITDTLVLVLLAFITSAHTGQLNLAFWIRLTTLSILFGFTIFKFYPFLGRWFFKNVEGEKTSPYIFILLLVFAAAFLSKLAGLEPIIGAFMAGLALNRLVSGNTLLLQRIDFVGNALFIPFFLIGVGMVVNVNVLREGPYAVYVATVLTLVAFSGKWIAAYLTQKVFRYSVLQRRLIFGLSSTHAAATLAVIFIGYRIGLIDIHILNGTIVLILATCLVGSLVTDRAARKLALDESHEPVEVPAFPERILIPIANPANVDKLLEVALAFKTGDPSEPVFPISVIEDNEHSRENLIICRRKLDKALEAFAGQDVRIQPLTRVDVNTVSGINRAIKEIMASMLVIGWGGTLKTSDRIFGSLIDKITGETRQMTLVTRLRQPLHTFKRVKIICPPNTEYETGFSYWLGKMLHFGIQSQARLVFIVSKDLTSIFRSYSERLGKQAAFSLETYPDWEEAFSQTVALPQDELLVVVSAREGTVSFIPQLDTLPERLNAMPEKNSFLLLYPEQAEKIRGTGVIPASDIHLAPLINRVEQFGKFRRIVMKRISSILPKSFRS